MRFQNVFFAVMVSVGYSTACFADSPPIAISLSPQFCVGYCALGCALSNLNQYEQALDNFNIAVSLETRAPESTYTGRVVYAF